MQEIVYHTNYKLESTYWWFVARNRIVKHVIDSFCKLDFNHNLLDVGCGTGAFAAEMMKSTNVIALDTSPIALEYTRKRGIKTTYNCYLSEFPKQEHKIDAITMLDVIEHIEDDSGVVKDAFKILDSNGYFIATVPAFQWLWSKHDEIHMHYRRYGLNQFEKLFSDAGFKVLYSSYFNTFLLPPAALKRFIDKITGADKKQTSPIDEVSPFMDNLFRNIFLIEQKLLPKVSLPFGLSIILVAKKL
jgi:ubiquinone/menaquinone biosynthesis C-methylase UbiE